MKKIRCAIYTRKSSEDGLEQEFNSLDAQREACAAYIQSQKHEGWVLLPEHYDDGGLSGGTMNRPALQSLMHAVDEGLVDQIVVYKIDRLTRSLADFAKLVDRLDAANASFVSVTQSFNTSTSMGRLTLNVLLSFAQFEREVTAERIRDKIAASKRKGLWMGGTVPIGYDADGRSLMINVDEAQIIETLYRLYEDHGTISSVKQQADQLGLTTRAKENNKKGKSFGRSHIHYILTNPVYAGRIRHKNIIHDGQHDALIEPSRWDMIQQKLIEEAQRPRYRKNSKGGQSPLMGKIFDEFDIKLTPTHSNKQGLRYRYYVSKHLVTAKASYKGPYSNWRLPAKQVEDQIAEVLNHHLNDKQTQLLNNQATIEDHQRLAQTFNNSDTLIGTMDLRQIIERIKIKRGEVAITLNQEYFADYLQIKHDLLNEDILTFKNNFQVRKRRVEKRLIIGQGSNNPDPVLIKNLKRAHAILKQAKTGTSINDIAAQQSTSKQRITELLKLAFLSPHITKTILHGDQSPATTSDKLLKTNLPICWKKQQALIETFGH